MFDGMNWCNVGGTILVVLFVWAMVSWADFKRSLNNPPMITDWKHEVKDDLVYIHPPTVCVPDEPELYGTQIRRMYRDLNGADMDDAIVLWPDVGGHAFDDRTEESGMETR